MHANKKVEDLFKEKNVKVSDEIIDTEILRFNTYEV
jgi:hypothetical protein